MTRDAGPPVAAAAGSRPGKKAKTVLGESREIQLAIDLIRLGARLQLLETETSLSRDRLLKLYKELLGVSPPKGMLPFSTDWFLTWQPNIHASLFVGIHRQLMQHAGLESIDALVKGYRLYLEQLPPEPGAEPVLSLTRAWTLLRFLNSSMLEIARCRQCGGEFIVQPQRRQRFVCGLCRVPSRAGKTRKVLDARAGSTQPD